QLDSDPGLLGDCGRSRIASLRRLHVRAVALVRQFDRSFWRALAADNWSNDSSRWFYLVRCSISKWKLLDEFLSRSDGTWARYDNQCRTADDYRYDLCW